MGCLRVAAIVAPLIMLRACTGRTDAQVGPLPAAALAMSETVRARALAYPDATVTDVQENKGRSAACGLVRLADKRPHVILAFSDQDGWTVSTPYLIKPDSWDDERNRTLSDNKLQVCARSGINLPPTD